MGPVAQTLLKLFRGSSETQSEPRSKTRAQARITRRSSGLNEMTRALAGRDDLCVLDVGPTSPENIQYFTELGYKVYSEDVLLASKDRDLLTCNAEGNSTVEENKFLKENLSYGPQTFD